MKILNLLPLIGISIIVFIIYKIGFINIYKTLITANLYYVFIAVIFLFISVLVLVLKWYMILKIQNVPINFFYALKLYLIGIFYGVITPARTGSLIRASYLKDKTNKSFGGCVSSIILERLMDLFVIFIYAIVGCIVFSKYIYSWLPVIFIFFILFLSLSVFLLKRSVSRLFLILVYKFLIPEKLKEKSKEIYNSFYDHLPSFKKLIYPLIFTFITWIILSIHIYMVAKAYSVHIPFFYIVLIFSIGTVISLIPITVGGLGTREAALIFLFSFFNVPAVKVISISFLSLILANILVPFTGFILSLKEPQPGKLL